MICPATRPRRAYTRNNLPAAHVPDTAAQQAFISEVAPGAMAAQSRYGIPAAVTIAQAIDESGWGQSALAIRDHNLFGIKGSGPAGTDMLPTREYQNGQWVTLTAPFRVYHNVAESIADHGQLLATGPSYQHAMADRHLPDAFATDLTGVYATDPQYGSNLIAIMRLYNLYRYNAAATAASQTTVPSGSGGQDGTASQGAAAGHGAAADAGAATIPGVLDAYAAPARSAPIRSAPIRSAPAAATATAAAAVGAAAAAPVSRAAQARRPAARVAPRPARTAARASRYVPQIPRAVTTAFITTAKVPLSRAEPLYDDVASSQWHPLGATGRLRLDAVPGPAALLARLRGKAGHGQRGRNGVPHEIRSARPVRQ